ncbi:hypothetical protein [Janthinobacterium sp. RB2P8]|uniref:hypothetical protein n=1 Tax=Janthinobacterium sp. RB2P8 TaxID=3424191 RepID=UPI003F23249F
MRPRWVFRQACRCPSGSLGHSSRGTGAYHAQPEHPRHEWQPVADISAVDPLLPEDLACFRELRDVLQRYGALDRFGISLIQRQFDIADDEELMEFTDV